EGDDAGLAASGTIPPIGEVTLGLVDGALPRHPRRGQAGPPARLEPAGGGGEGGTPGPGGGGRRRIALGDPLADVLAHLVAAGAGGGGGPRGGRPGAGARGGGGRGGGAR